MSAPAPMPFYWMHETSGVLAPAVRAWLDGGELAVEHVVALRAYLRQWIAGDWRGDGVCDLLNRVDGLTDRTLIAAWLADALRLGIDPL